MKIIFVGGGTAGHINPAIALADYVKSKEPDTEILYVGAKNGMEKELVTRCGYKFEGITVSGFSRKINFEGLKKNIKTLKNIIISTYESKIILKNFKPDICVGTGGYVCGAFLRTAGKMNIPYIIHDSNSYPGVTTKLLAKKAAKVLLVDSEARKHLPKSINSEITGTPIRNKITKIDKETAKKELNLTDAPTILSFGGSLGARAINNVISELISNNFSKTNYNFIHGFGKSCNNFLEKLHGVDLKSPRLIIKNYIHNMAECMAAADLIICRAGATTISEIEGTAKPAILIPSPNVAENHQFHNAMALVSKNAASIIEEKNLNEDNLIREINKILENDGEVAKEYSKNLRKISVTDSDEKIYRIIKNIVNKQEG